MRRFQRRLRSQYRRLGSVLTVLGLMSPAVVFAAEIQVGRYATVRALPTQEQVQLLSAIVNVVFPASVVTVGQAMRYLLEPGGYRLADEAAASPVRAALLKLPLPHGHRALGPMPLRIALETLAGPAFRLVEDPLHRLVSLERCVAAQPQPAISPAVSSR
ncbi:MAG: pili assembly chaperone [Thiohalocapsa sp.]